MNDERQHRGAERRRAREHRRQALLRAAPHELLAELLALDLLEALEVADQHDARCGPPGRTPP